jgi:hypothetical protein
MSVKIASSNQDDLTSLITEIKEIIGEIKAKMVVFFASSKYDLEKLGKGLEKAYPTAEVVGCSTSGELISGKMLKNSVVIQVMDASTVADVSATFVDHVKEKGAIENALKEFEKHYGQKLNQMDTEKYVGMVLFDGLSGVEEKIMDQLGNLTDLIFVGGSAGDDLKFKKTEVFARGKAGSNALVLALIKPTKGYEIIKTQSFTVLNKTLTADEVDEAARTVIKFNGVNSVEAYATAVRTPVNKVSEKFMSNPVGLIADGEPYVRSPQQVKDGKIVFYCNIKKGTQLSLLESTDIIKDTAKAVEKSSKAAGIINFNCILRTLELEAKKQTEAYGKLFTKTPTIGFSTYGEAYLGHINQTATILVLK